jgi:hypothetical protein
MEKSSYLKAYVVPGSKPVEVIKLSLPFADLAVNGVVSELYETGINSANPSVLVVQSARLYLDYGSDVELHVKSAIEHSEGDVLGRSATKQPSSAIAFKEIYLGATGDYPSNLVVADNSPIYEEQIFVGVENKSSGAVSGEVAVTLHKYKMTAKAWAELANDQVAGGRFI